MIRWEAVIVTLLGPSSASSSACSSPGDRPCGVPSEIEVYTLPVGWLAITAAAAAGLLAATVPARRTSRVDVRRAITME